MSTLKTNSIEPVTHSDPLVFRTNATETMRLATDGSLLLGIQSSPDANTVIAGQKSANAPVLSRLYNPNTGTSALVALQLNNNVNNGYVVNYGQNHATFPKAVSLENDTNGNGLLLWSGSAAGPIRFCAGSGAERMRITSNGNVGIGTSSPTQALLQVTTSGGSQGQIATSSNDYGGLTIFGHDMNGDCYIYETAANKNFRIGTSNTEQMRITSTGNVGIGTNAPGTKLSIAFNTDHGSDSALSDTFAGGILITNSNFANASGNKCGLRLTTGNAGVPGNAYGSFIDIIAQMTTSDSNDLVIASEYWGTSAGSRPTTPILRIRGSEGTINYNGAEFGRPSGSAPLFAVRAWGIITPNGANNPSSVVGGNVASVVRQSDGVLRVTLTTAMPNTNYAVVASCVGQSITNVNLRSTVCTAVQSASTFDLRHGLGNTSTSTDFSSANIISFMVIG